MNFLIMMGLLHSATEEDIDTLREIPSPPEDIDSVFDFLEKLHNMAKLSEPLKEVFFEEKMKIVGRC